MTDPVSSQHQGPARRRLDAFGAPTVKGETSFAQLYARIFIPAIVVGLLGGGMLFFAHDNGRALNLIMENLPFRQ